MCRKILILVPILLLGGCSKDDNIVYIPLLTSCNNTVSDWIDHYEHAEHAPFVILGRQRFLTNYHSYPDLAGVILLKSNSDSTQEIVPYANQLMHDCSLNHVYEWSEGSAILEGLPDEIRESIDRDRAVQIYISEGRVRLYYEPKS